MLFLDQVPPGMSHFLLNTHTHTLHGTLFSCPLLDLFAPECLLMPPRLNEMSFLLFTANSKKDSENTPVKGGNMADLGAKPL